MPSISAPVDHLDIPGPRDVAVKKYSTWQQSQVTDETLKVEYQKACDVTLEDGLDWNRSTTIKTLTFSLRKALKEELPGDS
jgi:hypothetical protein